MGYGLNLIDAVSDWLVCCLHPRFSGRPSQPPGYRVSEVAAVAHLQRRQRVSKGQACAGWGVQLCRGTMQGLPGGAASAGATFGASQT